MYVIILLTSSRTMVFMSKPSESPITMPRIVVYRGTPKWDAKNPNDQKG